jgi:hypothetical protein
MQKYGQHFVAVPNHPYWFAALRVEDGDAEAASNRIHAEFNLGSDLVFCGLAVDDGVNKLYLIESGDPVEVAREFRVGSQAECYDEGAAEQTPEMLRAIYRVAPFSPVLVNPAAYQAIFTRRIDKSAAKRILRSINEHGCQGMDGYAGELPDFTDEDIIASLVGEQRLHLWWD